MIDWHHIEDLKQAIGADAFAEVVVIFLQEADGCITRMSDAPSLTVMQSELHALKGTSLNLGFRKLAEICEHFEQLAETGAADIPVDEVKGCYAASRTAFLSKLHHPAA